jgi:hypothetical protein
VRDARHGERSARRRGWCAAAGGLQRLVVEQCCLRRGAARLEVCAAIG